jgi:hypothetical protein
MAANTASRHSPRYFIPSCRGPASSLLQSPDLEHGTTATTGSGTPSRSQGLPQPRSASVDDSHDVIPGLARPWSGGRSAPGAEGTGKGREPPADGNGDHPLASEGLSHPQRETHTIDNLSRTGTRATTGYPHPPAESLTTRTLFTRKD